MPRRLPPLNPLRAFEAAARHGHVRRAAEELCVTSSAVSHQIRVLEDYLCVCLFDRQGRRLRLTPTGEAYLASVRQAFDLIADASRVTQFAQLKGDLTVCVPPGFASKWLARRVGRFLRAHPEIVLNILPIRDAAVSLEKRADLFVLYGDGQWPKHWVHEIASVELFPVCSPKLLNMAPAIRDPADLLQQVILHEDDGAEWQRWFAANGIVPSRVPSEARLSYASLAIDAAVAAGGVALGDTVLAHDDLASGQLVRLFDTSVPARGRYYVVCALERIEMPKIWAFVTWLLEVNRPGNPGGHLV
ncbi:MAG: transcriptional regulator GcvA [Luteimonas sp.]